MICDLQTDFDIIKSNIALWNELNFEDRIEALEKLEFILDQTETLLQRSGPSVALFSLKQSAQRIKSQLEAIDEDLFARLRGAIQRGLCRGEVLLGLITTYAGSGLLRSHLTDSFLGYDALDVFTNGFFAVQDIPAASLEIEPEMVFYQKTPTRIVLELVQKAHLTQEDVFYDLESGLGFVCALVNLLTGTPTKGIELEPAYCTYATMCATNLNLSEIVFSCEDARTADYSDGTVFYLYTPFQGQILQDVLNKLQMVSWNRPIRIFSYGPCTTYVAQQSWLTSTSQPNDYFYELGEFKSWYVD